MRWLLTPTERQALRRAVRMLRIRKGSFALSLFYGVAGLGSALGLAAVSAWLIARASQMPPVLALSVAATAVRMFGVFRALLRYMQRLSSHQVALDGMDSLRLGVYDAVMDGPIDRVARLQRGDVLSRIGADIDAVGDYVVKSLLPFLVTAVVGVGTVAGFAFLSVPAAAVVAAGLLVSGVIAPLLTARAARQAEALETAARRDLSVSSLTILESADELAVDDRLNGEFGRLERATSRLNAAKARSSRLAAFAASLDRLAMGLTVVGVLLVAIPQTNAGLVAAVALAVLVLTPLSAFEGTADLGPATVQLISSARAAERIMDLLGPESADEPSSHHPVPQTGSGPQIRARDLAVGWPGREAALRGVSLELTPGSTTAVVGPSGVGKSTLLYTLAGMLQPKQGQANLNGVPLWKADRTEVTDLVSLTTEDAHVFATTVFENLRVARGDLTREQAGELMERVGLGEWLRGLPQGIDTMLGVGATTISGGERRRLLLARALASPAPLLLLDEPGEHLDPETADRIFETLVGTSGQERGLIIVTHRLSGLPHVDRVMLLTPGSPGQPAEVAAVGTHDQLVRAQASYRWAAEQE